MIACLTFLFIFGSFGSGDGQFDNARGIVADLNNVYVAERFNGRVQKFTKDGAHLWTSDLYVSPRSIAINEDGNIYVLDTGARSVTMTAPDGTRLKTWSPADIMFQAPNGIAYADGFVYVVDPFAAHVWKFTKDGFTASNHGGGTDGWGSFGSEDSLFSFPRGITAGDGFVYVVDAPRIKKYTTGGVYVTSWEAGSGMYNADYHDQAVYVADTGNSVLRIFFTNGVQACTITGFGPLKDVSVSDRVYVANENEVKVLSLPGSVGVDTRATTWGRLKAQ